MRTWLAVNKNSKDRTHQIFYVTEYSANRSVSKSYRASEINISTNTMNCAWKHWNCVAIINMNKNRNHNQSETYFYELQRIHCSFINENITKFIALVILDSRHIAWLYNLHQLQTEAQTNHERNVGLIWNSHAVVTSWAVFASYTMKIFNNHGCGFNILIQNTHSETCVLHKVLPTEWWSHVFCSAFICSVFSFSD